MKNAIFRKLTTLGTVLGVVTILVGLGHAVASSAVSLPQTNSTNSKLPLPSNNAKNFKAKAPVVIPSKPFDLLGEKAKKSSRPAKLTQQQSLAATTDTTPPIAPSQVTASARSIFTINAQWDAAQDAESGISYYIFGVGTNSTGDYNNLANIRWWQVTNDTNMSVNLNLDSSQTYYVSVYAVNGAGIYSTPVISNPIHPVWQTLGQQGNKITLQFAPAGIDTNGNPTAGWTPDQIALMSSFFDKMYPILEQIYGPPSASYTLTSVRDLHYHNTNIFIPSLDEIHMDDGFYPQLFTHELVHAFRDKYLLSSDQDWNFDATLSPFEESFAQAVSYEAMNQYVATYPNDTIVPGNSLWGSGNDWDYDFQNTSILKGTDFWSDGGGTGLYWLKYEMGAAAMRKINLESPGFYKRFNQEYYNRINANPATVRVSRPLIVDIIKTVVPEIEGQSAVDWVNEQNIFYAKNVYGEKIFNRIQDYQWTSFYAFQDLYFLNTMACGSEWVCWDGQQWVYYKLNGSQGNASLVDDNGNTVWSGNLAIAPPQNPSDGYYAFGSATKGLTTASTLLPWPGGNIDNYIMNLNDFGLYKFSSTFTDPTSAAKTTSSIYRVMGSQIANDFRGVWGGILGHKNGTIYLDHEGFASEAGIPVTNGAFAGSRSWTGVNNPRTGGHDSVPGKVFITFVDSDTGKTYHAQRNVDYGSVDGSQMFLLDFAVPSVSLTSPSPSTVHGTITLAANASNIVDLRGVQFRIDGQAIGGQITSSPFTTTLDTKSLADGNHSVQATATDLAGNTTTSASVQITVDNTAPTVSVTSPSAGSMVSNTVTISAGAADNIGLSKVEFYVDGSMLATATTSPYAVTWNTNLVQLGTHTLTAKAYDQAGNSTLSNVTSVTVADKILPTVMLTSPADGGTVNKGTTTTITATANDNRGVAKVEFYINNVLKCTDTTVPYACSWAVPNAKGTKYALLARVYDIANNQAQASVTVTSK